MRTILHIVIKELHQVLRDKRMLGLSFMSPILQLVLLGYAATTDVTSIPLLVVDQDKTSISRDVINSFTNSGYFELEGVVHDERAIDAEIEHGRAWLAVVIPPKFSENISQHVTAPVQVVVDGSDATSANVSLGYANLVLNSYSANIVAKYQTERAVNVAPMTVTPQLRVWYNADLKSRNFMVPGVVALVLMIITMTLTSLAVVKEKESGTLEQLLVTPIKPYQLITGKLIPFVVIGFIDVAVSLFIAHHWFLVPLQGSLVLLFALSSLFVLNTLGLGLFVSTISKTQQQAMMTAQFFIFMPFIYLSGFTFPVENMPRVVQYITYIIPLRYFITIIRGIFLKGNGIAELWQPALALFGLGALVFSLSILRFRRRLS